jgi:hypothetical protein
MTLQEHISSPQPILGPDHCGPRLTDTMGLQSVVKGIVSRMEKVDTMNMNTLGKWCKRVLSIAKDLGQAGDESRFVMDLST